jgi:Amt family ammonium transporter
LPTSHLLRTALPGIFALSTLWPASAFAQAAAPKVDSGDTAFLIIATALVLFMTPGLAFFYGGMVRRKNVLATLMQSYMLMAMVGVQWVVVGYSIAFSPDATGTGLFGGFSWFGLSGVGGEPSTAYATTTPHLLFMMYQGMFATITPALITGAFAERIKFGPFLVFSLLWTTLVYDPLAHWVWGSDGWLYRAGALDFAGGTVVHISSAVSAGATLFFVKRRRGYPNEAILPHNVPFAVLGVGILWFGWFGFNAGSALGANAQAASAFVATNTGAAAAALGWMLTDWLRHGKPAVLGAVSGAVAGLVAITPACGFVSPVSAILIGGAAGVFCNLAVHLRHRFRLDDSLDVIGVHGVGGILGAVLTGVLCSADYLKHGDEVFSRGQQILVQLVGVGATIGFTFVMSFALLFAVDKLMGLRVSTEQEIEGLDLSQHGESGYN